MHLSFGKSALFWYPKAPRSLQVPHLKIILHTTELALLTQRSFFLRLLSVILPPLRATFSWHHVTIAYVIKFAFGKMTGCTSLISSIDLSPTLRTPSVSRKGSNLRRLLDLYIIVLISMKAFRDWMNVVAVSWISSSEPSPTALCL